MIGLEYVLKTHNIPYTQLANELGIKRKNITCWLSGKQNISKKHLPALSKMFNEPEDFFQKEMTIEYEIQALKELIQIKEQILKKRNQK